MGKKILVVCVVAIFAILLSSFIVGVQSFSVVRHRRQADNTDNIFGEIENERGVPRTDAATATPPSASAGKSTGDNTTTSTNTTALPSDLVDNGGSDGTLTTVVVILILGAIAIAVAAAAVIFIRIRKKRQADYEKKTQIQMSSTSNAGVYMDLTPAAGDMDGTSPETEHLNKDDD